MVSAWIPLILDDPLAFACKCPFSCERRIPLELSLSSLQRRSTSAPRAPVLRLLISCAPIKSSISQSLHPLRRRPGWFRARLRPSPLGCSARIPPATFDSLGWNSLSHLSKVLPL